MTTSTRFCIIRHGETDWNTQRRYQGQIDMDLNRVGEEQARALIPALAEHEFSAAYTSDLKRARRTAQLALSACQVSLEKLADLRERHYGIFQGMTADEVRIRHPEAHHHYKARTPDYDYESGESMIDFAWRVRNGFAMLAKRHPGGTVVVFTHGGVLDVMYRTAVGRDLAGPRDFPIPNTGINWLEHQDEAWQLITWADCRHLTREEALDETAQ